MSFCPYCCNLQLNITLFYDLSFYLNLPISCAFCPFYYIIIIIIIITTIYISTHIYIIQFPLPSTSYIFFFKNKKEIMEPNHYSSSATTAAPPKASKASSSSSSSSSASKSSSSHRHHHHQYHGSQMPQPPSASSNRPSSSDTASNKPSSSYLITPQSFVLLQKIQSILPQYPFLNQYSSNLDSLILYLFNCKQRDTFLHEMKLKQLYVEIRLDSLVQMLQAFILLNQTENQQVCLYKVKEAENTIFKKTLDKVSFNKQMENFSLFISSCFFFFHSFKQDFISVYTKIIDCLLSINFFIN